ncbi:MAG: cytochrome c3 family protein [Planctomycetota bacterium]|jgi:hypothetical protein
MDRLLEFMTATKGVEYLIVVAFLLAFVAFWQLMSHRGKGLMIRTVPPGVLALGIAGFVVVHLNAAFVAPAPPIAVGTPLLSSPVLADMYGPASIEHELHLSVECTLCHHHSGEKTPACATCHNSAFAPGALAKPGLAHAYHLRCISCHKEERLGPTECTGCHRKAQVPPLSIKHPLTNVRKCLSCHAAKIPGVPVLPADHAGAPNGVCQICHHPSTTPPRVAWLQVPHDIEGHKGCGECHGDGIAELPDHAGRTDDTCTACHWMVGGR